VICGPIDLSPYASSEGITNSHLSPSDINCMASVQPLITWFGANFVGSPRLYEESNSSPCLFKKERGVCVCERERKRTCPRDREYFISKRGRYARARASRPNHRSSSRCTFPSFKNVFEHHRTGGTKIQNSIANPKSSPRHPSPLLGRRLPYLDGRPSVVAQARRVHFRFRSSFRSRFQNSVLQPGR